MTKNDKKIKQLQAVVSEREEKLGKKPRFKPDTNASFKYPSGYSLNLHVIRDMKRLVSVVAFLMEKENYHTKACEELGVEVEFDWDGYPSSSWISDVQMRIDIIKYEEEEKKLKKLKTQLNSLMSEDARTAQALADIEDLLI